MSLSLEEEVKIVKQVLDGDKEAFKDLMQAYFQAIFYYLLPVLNYHWQNTEDATAQTFAKAYFKLRLYNQKHRFSTWLYRLAHNTAIDLLRTNKNFYSLPLDEANKHQIQKTKLSLEFNLERVFHRLNPEDKCILNLALIQGFKHSEIAKHLNISEKQVPLKIHRAKKRAKKIALNQT